MTAIVDVKWRLEDNIRCITDIRGHLKIWNHHCDGVKCSSLVFTDSQNKCRILSEKCFGRSTVALATQTFQSHTTNIQHYCTKNGRKRRLFASYPQHNGHSNPGMLIRWTIVLCDDISEVIFTFEYWQIIFRRKQISWKCIGRRSFHLFTQISSMSLSELQIFQSLRSSIQNHWNRIFAIFCSITTKHNS